MLELSIFLMLVAVFCPVKLDKTTKQYIQMVVVILAATFILTYLALEFTNVRNK